MEGLELQRAAFSGRSVPASCARLPASVWRHVLRDAAIAGRVSFALGALAHSPVPALLRIVFLGDCAVALALRGDELGLGALAAAHPKSLLLAARAFGPWGGPMAVPHAEAAIRAALSRTKQTVGSADTSADAPLLATLPADAVRALFEGGAGCVVHVRDADLAAAASAGRADVLAALLASSLFVPGRALVSRLDALCAGADARSALFEAAGAPGLADAAAARASDLVAACHAVGLRYDAAVAGGLSSICSRVLSLVMAGAGCAAAVAPGDSRSAESSASAYTAADMGACQSDSANAISDCNTTALSDDVTLLLGLPGVPEALVGFAADADDRSVFCAVAPIVAGAVPLPAAVVAVAHASATADAAHRAAVLCACRHLLRAYDPAEVALAVASCPRAGVPAAVASVLGGMAAPAAAVFRAAHRGASFLAAFLAAAHPDLGPAERLAAAVDARACAPPGDDDALAAFLCGVAGLAANSGVALTEAQQALLLAGTAVARRVRT